MTDHPRPWDVALNNVIGEIVAEETMRGHGVSGLDVPLAGLAGIFGVKDGLKARAFRLLAQRLNQEPINAAARQWLPASWQGDDGHLYVLTLMLWAMTDGGLAAPSYWETEDLVGGLIANMRDWNPVFVMALLENPEYPESAAEEAAFSAADLEEAEDAEGAAALLLELLESAAIAGTLYGSKND